MPRITKPMNKNLTVRPSIKQFGKNVVGGAKIVSSAIKNKVVKAFKK